MIPVTARQAIWLLEKSQRTREDFIKKDNGILKKAIQDADGRITPALGKFHRCMHKLGRPLSWPSAWETKCHMRFGD